MKLKPRFDFSFFLYMISGLVFIGLLFFFLTSILGIHTVENYHYFFKNEVNDTISEIDYIGPFDYAYFHGGTIETLKLKNHSDNDLALYLESYKHLDQIEIGDRFVKKANSRVVTIISNQKEFDIVLEDLITVRNQKKKSFMIMWIVIYIVSGIIKLFVPLKFEKLKTSKFYSL